MPSLAQLGILIRAGPNVLFRRTLKGQDYTILNFSKGTSRSALSYSFYRVYIDK